MREAFWPPHSTAVLLPDIYAGPDLVYQGTFWGLKTSGNRVQTSEKNKNLVTIDPEKLYQARTEGAVPQRAQAQKEAQQALEHWDKRIGIIRISLLISAQSESPPQMVKVVQAMSGRKDLLLHIDRSTLHRIIRDDYAKILISLFDGAPNKGDADRRP